MPQLTIQQAFELAIQHHRSGGLREAEALCRQILAAQPGHGEALHMLGMVAFADGRPAEAAALLRQATDANPQSAECQSHLGVVLAASRAFAEAAAALRRAVALRPNRAEDHYNLGLALREAGNLDEAVAAFGQALALRPQFAQAWNDLGNALKDLGQIDAAADAYQRALAIRPAFVSPQYNLGIVYSDQNRLDDAIAALTRTVALDPNHGDAYKNLGNRLKDAGRLAEAIACYRRSAALEAVAGPPRAPSNLLYALHFDPDLDARQIYEEHVRWNAARVPPFRAAAAAGEAAAAIAPHDNDRDPDRPLRIGYVSPDFNGHPVGRFFLPLVAHHDRSSFEVYCYSDVRRPDATTDQIRAQTHVWRETASLDDAQLADLIRQDRVDILVDLMLHTAGSRLSVFARRPAPVQVTYLAYCSTSGLETMDYRLSDPYLDPAGGDESVYTEKTIRLPRTYWCFQPPLEIASLPAARAMGAPEGITFGCLNNYGKVTRPTMDMWRDLLRRVPRSRLLLHSREGAHRQHAKDYFAAAGGVDPDRIQFVGSLPPLAYHQQYNQIDIALDPFPFPGATTTCDALWMGVPVVSLVGRTAVSRAGLSILSNVGLPELVARTAEQYVQIAAELAADRPRRIELRSTLRERMLASPLMDAPQFARDVEAACRNMWGVWCTAAASA